MSNDSATARLMVFQAQGSFVKWLLWIEEDGQGNRFDRLWAGRVKLQDEAVATTYCVLYDALEKLESSMAGAGIQRALFGDHTTSADE